MTKTHLSIVGAISAVLAGCAGSPAQIGMASPEKLAAASDAALCNAFAFSKSQKARAELERREALTADEWKLAERKSVAIGMRRLVLICSQGTPGVYGGINRTVTAAGTREQWVYREGGSSHASYVYVEGDVVTAYQD